MDMAEFCGSQKGWKRTKTGYGVWFIQLNSGATGAVMYTKSDGGNPHSTR